MSGEEKSPRDSVNLSSLEKDFSKIIQELLGDKTLEKFRIEFEKLHSALVDSQKQNETLVIKCSELNDEIINKSRQIEAVVTMSQNDQKLITSLRNEFEKAWEIVEISSRKEEKSRNIALLLRSEIDRLSEMIGSGTQIRDEQENALQQLEGQVSMLVKDIGGNKMVIEDLTGRITDYNNSKETLMRVVEDLTPTVEQFELDISSFPNIVEEIREEKNKILEEIKDSRERIDEFKEHRVEIKTMITEKNASLNDLRYLIDKEKYMMQFLLLDNNKVRRYVQKKDELLIKYRKNTEISWKLLNEAKANQSRKMANCIDLEQRYPLIIKNLDDERIDLENDLKEMKRYKSELKNFKEEYRKCFVNNQEIIINLRSGCNSKNMEIGMLKLLTDDVDNKLSKVANQIKMEKQEKTFEESQNKSTETDINNTWINAHEYKAQAFRIMTDISKENDAKKDIIQNMTPLISLINDHKSEDTNLKKKLNKIHDNIRIADCKIKSMNSDLNTFKQRLQLEYKGNEEIKSEYINIKAITPQLKDSLINLDENISITHLKKLDLEKQIDQFKKKSKQINCDTEAIKLSIIPLCDMANNKGHIFNEAMNSIRDLNQINKNIRESLSHIEFQITMRKKEKQIVLSKIDVLTNLLQHNKNSWKTLNKKIQEDERVIALDNERKNKLLQCAKRVQLLKGEKIVLEKENVKLQGLSKSIDEEIHHPLMISRWFFLESTNPEVASLLRMKFLISSDICNKIAKHTELTRKRDEINKKYERSLRHVERSTNISYDNEFRFLTETLSSKNRKLINLRYECDQNNDVVRSKLIDVSKVRGELGVQRSFLLKTKSREKTARATTADNRFRFKRGVKRFKGENVFVNGVFGYNADTNLPLVKAPNITTTRIQSNRGHLSFLPKISIQNEVNATIGDIQIHPPDQSLRLLMSSRRIKKNI